MILACLFIALGVILIGIEVKLVPGFGLIGLLGFVTSTYGSYLAIEDGGPLIGTLVITGSVGVALVGIVMMVRSRTAQSLVLESATTGQPSALAEQEGEMLVGMVGTTVTALRPAGVARFDGRRWDVVTDDALFVDEGSAVRVVRIAQNSVVVVPHTVADATGVSTTG